MTPASMVRRVDSGFAVHHATCDSFALPAAPAGALAGLGTDHDELIRYALELRSGYDRLGRIIGQLAGLIILARLSGRFEADWTAAQRVVEQIRHTETELHAVRVPMRAQAHHGHIVRAFEKVADVMRGFAAARLTPARVGEGLDLWTRELKQAGAMLGAAAVEKLGLMPVDFSQACCNCGSNPPQALAAHA